MKRLFGWYIRIVENVFDDKSLMSGRSVHRAKGLLLSLPIALIMGVMIWLAIFFSNLGPHYYTFIRRINANEISVNCGKGVDCDKVRIEWKYSMFEPKTIFEKNMQVEKNFNELGESIFFVFYDEKLKARISQHKRKDWLKHKYFFHVELDSAKNITIITVIEGDFYQFEQIDY